GVRNQFGLKQTYDTLFRFENSITPLNLVLGSVNVPWQFAYDAAVDQFLCEKYAIGITFVSEKEFKERSTFHSDKTDSRSAILYYGDWQGNPGKELRNAGESISRVQKILSKTDCEAEIIYEKVDQFLTRLATESENNSNVRIIHYLGHAEEDYLDVGKNDYLKPGVIIETIGVSFSSRPLVFLNACSSGKLPSEWKINDHLCTEFLAAGAGACIVTNFDVYDKTADAFQKYFYELYVEQNLSSGEALKKTILAMGDKNFQQNYRPDYDISRYAYCLFGDPTIKF
ncbi:CHAT domain-containing protein, partial [candidate division KSB1 bacterium]|nr:CHAT domain-containing protein [candidate division KSB1 bacterium]